MRNGFAAEQSMKDAVRSLVDLVAAEERPLDEEENEKKQCGMERMGIRKG